MSLLLLSNEILHQILSNSEILSPGDVYNIVVACRRLGEAALPALYQNLVFKNPQFPPILQNSTKGLTLYKESLLSYPARTLQKLSWARSAEFEWYHDNIVMWNEVHDLLSTITTLHTLCLRSSTWKECRYFGAEGIPARHSETHNLEKLLCIISDTSSLRNITLEDSVITTKEISSFLSLPNLKSLTIKQFSTWTKTPGEQSWLEPESKIESTAERLDIHSSSLPFGPDVEYIFRSLPHLLYLSWTTDVGSDCDKRRATRDHPSMTTEITKALLSLPRSLVEHDLLITEEQSYLGLSSLSRLDFRPFADLKKLRIQAEFLFYPSNNQDELANQLPYSLEELQVFFSDRKECFRKPANYDWALPLAKSKETKFPQLSRVKFQDSIRWGSNLTTFQCPDNVTLAFEQANIALKVVVNTPNFMDLATLHTMPSLNDAGLTAEDVRSIWCQSALRKRKFEARKAAENHCFKF